MTSYEFTGQIYLIKYQTDPYGQGRIHDKKIFFGIFSLDVIEGKKDSVPSVTFNMSRPSQFLAQIVEKLYYESVFFLCSDKFRM